MSTSPANNPNEKNWKFETKQIHSGWNNDSQNGATTLPIYLTSSYAFNDADHAAARFGLRDIGPVYSRLTNPTSDIAEQRINALEGGVGALLLSSGQSASTLSILNLGGSGNNVIVSSSLYGGTTALLKNSLGRIGIETRYVQDPNDPEEWKKLSDKKTVAFYGEVIPNPKGDILDLEAISNAAHEVGVPLIVDSTVATPYLVRPIEWGADIVVHSGTKYLNGHGNAISGVIVDAGNFDYTKDPERFPYFNEPEASYNGLNFGHDLGVNSPFGANISYIVRARAIGLRDFGFTASPLTAFLLEQGLETLSLRVQRHSDNALAVAKYLENRKTQVKSVSYAALESSPYYKLQQKYAPNGASGLLSFVIEGGLPAGKAFINALKLLPIVANIGDAKSLAIHPASTTHSQLNEQELKASGVDPGTVRLSLGIEHVDDIIADLELGFEAAAKATK